MVSISRRALARPNVGLSRPKALAPTSSRDIGLVALPRTARVWCRRVRPSRVVTSAMACVVLVFDSAELPESSMR